MGHSTRCCRTRCSSTCEIRSAALPRFSRVVRPGGRIYVAVAFLQPYHGYPHHYYNMTLQGLEQLFAEDFVIDAVGRLRQGFRSGR